jgi:hypothetical protein
MKRKVLIFIGITIASVAVAGIVKKGISQSNPPCTAEFVTRLQAGVGTEAPPPTTVGNISPAIASCAYYMQYRCNLNLSSTVQQRLAQLEQESWPGNCNGPCQLTRQEAQNIISAALSNVVTHLTDAQINSMATSSFQMTSGWTPPTRAQEVMLRASGPNVTQTTFTQTAQQLRTDPTLQAQFGSQISGEVNRRCNVLAYAIPSQWNVSTYDPYRVFMVAYALVADDNLGDPQSDISGYMTNMQGWLSSQGFNCPTTGRTMWGDAGYGYNRPVSTFFDDTAQLDLLNRYAAVHGLQ